MYEPGLAAARSRDESCELVAGGVPGCPAAPHATEEGRTAIEGQAALAPWPRLGVWLLGPVAPAAPAPAEPSSCAPAMAHAFGFESALRPPGPTYRMYAFPDLDTFCIADQPGGKWVRTSAPVAAGAGAEPAAGAGAGLALVPGVAPVPPTCVASPALAASGLGRVGRRSTSGWHGGRSGRPLAREPSASLLMKAAINRRLHRVSSVAASSHDTSHRGLPSHLTK
eukprot:scaffold23062_cov121-Isochrysis_galbana.AAC.3